MAPRRDMARSAGLVGLFTLASRVLGMAREAAMAALFPKAATDAFVVAFTLPNMFRKLLAEGSLTVSFIPVFSDARRGSEREARELVAVGSGATLLVVGLTCLAGVLAAPALVTVLAEGFRDDPDKFALTVGLTRWVFPYLLLASLTALAMGVLNTAGHFAMPALSPVALNAVTIACAIGLSAWLAGAGVAPIYSMAIGALLGGIAQVLLQFLPLARHGYLVWPRLCLGHPGLRRVAALMAPSVFGLAIYEVNIVLARLFASQLGEGAVSYLHYASRLVELPMGLFVVSIATVAMPQLAADASEGDLARLRDTFRRGLSLTLFLILPASFAFAAVGEPICSLLYQRGLFRWPDTRATAAVLAAFSIGMWTAGGVRATVPAFYALKEPRRPVQMAAVGLAVYVVAALALRGPLGVVGLALAVSASSTVQFLGLLWLLRARAGRLGLRALGARVAVMLLGSAACAAVAWTICRGGPWERGGVTAEALARLAAAAAAGGGVYLALARLARLPELGEILAALRRRTR